MNAKRNLSYDVIRVVALLMIVMVHVSAYMVIFFPDTANVEWSVGNLFNGLARAGVPMFIMLSGALLLREDKPFDTKKFFKRNYVNMLLLTVGWLVAYGLFYSVLLPILEGKSVVPADFWGYLLTFKGCNYPHLWYMLMVLGLYLMIPVLRLFVKRENKAYVLGMIIAAVVVQFGTTTANFFTRACEVSVGAVVDKLHLEPVTGFIGLLLLGWYLNEYTLKKSSRIVLYGLGLCAVGISTYMVYTLIEPVGNIRDFVFEATTLPAFIYGAALFVLLQSLLKNKTAKGKLFATLSDCSFGIYLIHVCVMELFVRLILPYERFGTGKPLAYILIAYGFTLLVSFAIVFVVGRIKGLRKIFFNR